MKTEIYIIRHAEAEGNLYRRAHGWHESLLTDRGNIQAERLRLRMTGIRLDAIYSSDLIRTMKTAEAVSRACGVAVTPEPRLREIYMGRWEDVPWGLLRRLEPERLEGFGRSPQWAAPMGESMAEVYARTGAALSDIAARPEGGAVWGVCHAISKSTMFARMAGGVEHVGDNFGGQSYVANASVSLLEYENGVFTQVLFSDDAHIDGVRSHVIGRPDSYTGKPELWFRSANGEDDVEHAAAGWLESWRAVYGGDMGFSYPSARDETRRMLRGDPAAVRFAMLGEDEAGVLLLDTGNLWESDCGHIALFMLHEPYRGFGLAPQLLGEAAALYRARGRDYLRLRVSVANSRALSFYKKYGFYVCSYEGAADGGQYIMKKYIAPGEPPVRADDWSGA